MTRTGKGSALEELRKPHSYPMIVISRKLFCMILLGLATVAAASLCSMLHLSMDLAAMAFIATWLAMVGIFELINFDKRDLPADSPEE